MSLNSMTGYGKGMVEENGLKITIELKSVNHRFLDLTIKLPKFLSFAEDLLRKNLKETFNRGHIDVFVNLEDNRKDKTTITFDYSLAQSYIEASKKIAEEFFVKDNLGTYEVLSLPDVVKNTVNEESEEILTNLVLQAFKNSADNLSKMRATEGTLIEKDLLQKVDNIQQIVKNIEALAPTMVEDHRVKLKDRMEELLKDVTVDETRLLNEVSFYADKVCIDEEITRLNSHIIHFGEIIKKGGVCGKQIDFIVQEMNRETNTIGSKCNNYDVANLVVSLKSEIEKIREQIQNIE